MDIAPHINPQQTGECIRFLMLSHNLSVKELQEILSLSCPQTIYHWLNGTSLPTVDHLYSLSRYFHVSIDSLLVGEAENT